MLIVKTARKVRPTMVALDSVADDGRSDEHAQLTERERELILLIGQGLPNKVIAHEMQISPNTVRAHIGNIMRKYRLYNRTQIAINLTPLVRARTPNAIAARRGPHQ
jgi:DNA-binding NarL/FixJ family response regulator